MSGYTADVIGKEGVLDPGVAYLPKPFTPAELSIKVREVLGQATSVGKILVVDDDEAVRTMPPAGAGRSRLRRAVRPPMACMAMRLVSEHPFDVVLTDLIMPDREGIEDHSRSAARLSGHSGDRHVGCDGRRLSEDGGLPGRPCDAS